jgi:uncharacterized protein (TIRG00374 family)
MKKFLLLLVSFLIGAGLFVWIAKMVGWKEIKNAFLVFTGWQGLAILGMTLIMALIGTWKWRLILRGEGVKMSFKNLLNSYFAGFSIMFLAPILVWGGEIFRGYILKEKDSVPWSKAMASVIIDRILEWTANLTVIFFGSLFFLLMIDFPPLNLALIFGGVFLFFVAVVTFFYFKSAKRESIIKFFLPGDQDQPFDTEKEIFNFFKPRKILMWKAVGVAFLRALVMYFRAWLLVLFLGKSIGVLPVLSVLGFTYLAVMIPIPAALGSHEAIQTFAFNSLGLGASTATAFTMIIRVAELIIALAGVIILFRLGVILIKNALFKKINGIANKT